MRSIIYAGNDFSPICSAEVVEDAACPLVAEYARVPGRAGGELVSTDILPVDVRVRLFLDPGFDPDVVQLSEMRHRLHAWLCVPGGGTLVLPDDPEREYHDALLIAASTWNRLFESGECEVTFTLFDPIAYGVARVERKASFVLGGTWRTYPEFRIVAEAGNGLRVADASTGNYIGFDYSFSGGEAVVIDCAEERVFINDADARDCVALVSDFFPLEPGECELSFSGAAYFETRFRERWR